MKTTTTYMFDDTDERDRVFIELPPDTWTRQPQRITMGYIMKTTTTYMFDSIDERNRVFDELWPDHRPSTTIPGLFYVTPGIVAGMYLKWTHDPHGSHNMDD